MSEENSNFHQLLKLRAQENPEIIEWLRKRDNKYTSPAIQNEMLEAMALGMMRQMSTNILTRKDRFQLYFRSTTGDSRLNHLMMLHVHKDRTDAITLAITDAITKGTK